MKKIYYLAPDESFSLSFSLLLSVLASGGEYDGKLATSAPHYNPDEEVSPNDFSYPLMLSLGQDISRKIFEDNYPIVKAMQICTLFRDYFSVLLDRRIKQLIQSDEIRALLNKHFSDPVNGDNYLVGLLARVDSWEDRKRMHLLLEKLPYTILDSNRAFRLLAGNGSFKTLAPSLRAQTILKAGCKEEYVFRACVEIALGINRSDLVPEEETFVLDKMSVGFVRDCSFRILNWWCRVGILTHRTPISILVYLWKHEEGSERKRTLVKVIVSTRELRAAHYYWRVWNKSFIPGLSDHADDIHLLRKSFVARHNLGSIRDLQLKGRSFYSLARLVIEWGTLEDIDTDFLITWAKGNGALNLESAVFLCSIDPMALVQHSHVFSGMTDKVALIIVLGVDFALFLTKYQRMELLQYHDKYSGFTDTIQNSKDRPEFLQKVYDGLNFKDKALLRSLLDQRDFAILFTSVLDGSMKKDMIQAPLSIGHEPSELEPFLDVRYIEGESPSVSIPNEKYFFVALKILIDYIGSDNDRVDVFKRLFPSIVPFIYLYAEPDVVVEHLREFTYIFQLQPYLTPDCGSHLGIYARSRASHRVLCQEWYRLRSSTTEL